MPESRGREAQAEVPSPSNGSRIDNGAVSALYREKKKAHHILHDETQRKKLQCQVETDTAKGSVVKTVRVLLVPSLGEADDHLTAGLCPRVIDRGNSEACRRMEASRDHEHLEFRLGCACVERATEDRELPILVDRFLNDRWLVARNKKEQEVRGYSTSMDRWQASE